MKNLLNKVFYCSYMELLPKIPDGSVHAVITDPPYGINYQNNFTKKKKDKIAGDEDSFSYDHLGVEAYRILKPDCPIFAYTGWSVYPQHFVDLQLAGFSMKEPLIVQKRASGTHDLHGAFQSNSDWILFGHKGRFKFKEVQLLRNKRAGTIPNEGRKPVGEYKKRFPSCWFGEEYPWSSENPASMAKQGIDHPTAKTLNFIQWLILLCTNEGDTVVDPFCGSGTVPLVCKLLKRNFIACDIEQKYVDCTNKRLKSVMSLFS